MIGKGAEGGEFGNPLCASQITQIPRQGHKAIQTRGPRAVEFSQLPRKPFTACIRPSRRTPPGEGGKGIRSPRTSTPKSRPSIITAPVPGPSLSYTEKLSEPRPLTPKPLRAVKPSPISSAAYRPPKSPLHQPYASAAREAHKITQQPRITAQPPGGRHLHGLLTGCPQHSLMSSIKAPPPAWLATPPDALGAFRSLGLEAPTANPAPPPTTLALPPGKSGAPLDIPAGGALPDPGPRPVRPAPGLPSAPPDCICGLAAASQAERRAQSRAEIGGRAGPWSGPCLAVTLGRETVVPGDAARR